MTKVQLHGGPKDGDVFDVDDDIVEHNSPIEIMVTRGESHATALYEPCQFYRDASDALRIDTGWAWCWRGNGERFESHVLERWNETDAAIHHVVQHDVVWKADE